jgi:uncharacterized membrane protein
MVEKSPATDSRGRIRRFVGAWPRIFIAAAITAAVFVLLLIFAPGTWWTTRLLIAWDVGVGFFLVALAPLVVRADPAEIRWRAARQDVGQFAMLSLNAAAAVASLAAIYAELGNPGEGTAAWRLALAVATIILSWFFIHLIFAIHYAHEFYEPRRGKPGGLAFPGGLNEPDYWDFLYFSLVIGMTSQVSDVAVTDGSIRRTVAAHGVFAFFFNVALLALVVNSAADVIKRG